MSEFIRKYGEKAREDDIELARATAIALEGLIGPAQKKVDKIKDDTQREAHRAIELLRREHFFRTEKNRNGIFANLPKLFPMSITVEEYDSYDLIVREKLLREASINRSTLSKLMELTGGVELNNLPAPAAQEILKRYSEDYNYFVLKGISSLTYQGTAEVPYTHTDEFRRLHHTYISGEPELEID